MVTFGLECCPQVRFQFGVVPSIVILWFESRADVPSCLRALVPSCRRAFDGGFQFGVVPSIVILWFESRADVPSCPRAVVPSCRRTFVQSCPRTQGFIC